MRDPVGPIVTVRHGDLSVAVAPDAGGRIARLTVGDIDLVVGPADLPVRVEQLAWGVYPMIPWAGRIRDGRLAFDGRTVDLPRTMGGHAIHGVGYSMPWTVARSSPAAVELNLALPHDMRWPFGGRARQRITVDVDGLLLEMTLHADDEPFPASIGWHPWFRKPNRLDFAPTAMYRRDDAGIALDELVDVPAGPWDDCFVNDRPIGLEIGGVEIVLTSDCTDWVVFDERPYATCVEPQTSPPDAVNTAPRFVRPDEPLTAWVRLRPT